MAAGFDDQLTDVTRLQEIGSYDLYSPEVRAKLDELARRGSEHFGLPMCAVSIVLDSAQYLAGMHGIGGWMAEAQGAPVEWSFCANAVRSGAPYVIDDAAADEDHRENPLVAIDGIRCYAGAPLVSSRGNVLGAYCLVGDRPHSFTSEEIAELTGMAAEVVAEIERHPLGVAAPAASL